MINEWCECGHPKTSHDGLGACAYRYVKEAENEDSRRCPCTEFAFKPMPHQEAPNG